MKKLSDDDLDLNDFGVDLQRIQDYFSVEVLTDLEPQWMIRRAEFSWLGVQVLLRIMKQLENIKQYFTHEPKNSLKHKYLYG